MQALSRISQWVLVIYLVSSAWPSQASDAKTITRLFDLPRNTHHSVPYHELMQGCPRPDCFPSIDDPAFVDAEKSTALKPDDLVLALEHNGKARAYPTVILDRHEIVNDTLDGMPIVVSWCPLCGSGLVYRRVVNEETLEFGVSGFLHNSDLVMYDRNSGSLWGQISGEAIVGPHTGTQLEPVQATITRWDKWQAAHPNTEVLSFENKFGMRYQGSMYDDYSKSDELMFPTRIRRFEIHPKTIVFGMRHNNESLAVTEDRLLKEPRVSAELGGESISVFLDDSGTARATLNRTREPLTTSRLYWFGWLNFNPETALVK